MKKQILYAVIATSMLINCTKENEVITEPNGAVKKSFVDLNKSGYQGQLQYLNAHFDTFNFSVINDLKVKINNPEFDYKFFDTLYSNELNIAEKQYLSYIVLSKKDLLSDFRINPTIEKQKLILKYTKILTDTEYVGYCLLFNCITDLENSKLSINKSEVTALNQKIINYSRNNNFYKNAIATMSKIPNNKYLSKIEENQQFLKKLEDKILQ